MGCYESQLAFPGPMLEKANKQKTFHPQRTESAIAVPAAAPGNPANLPTSTQALLLEHLGAIPYFIPLSCCVLGRPREKATELAA